MGFNVIEYIKSVLGENRKQTELEMDLSVDENKEPYIDIAYYVNGNIAGLTRPDKLLAITNPAYVFCDHFALPKYPIKTIFYDVNSEDMNIKCGSDETRVHHANSNEFIVGYIVDPKANLSYEEKVLMLYELMLENINYKNGMSVNGTLLNPLVYGIDSFDQVEEISEERREQEGLENLQIIDSELGTKLSTQNNKINIKKL